MCTIFKFVIFLDKNFLYMRTHKDTWNESSDYVEIQIRYNHAFYV